MREPEGDTKEMENEEWRKKNDVETALREQQTFLHFPFPILGTFESLWQNRREKYRLGGGER